MSCILWAAVIALQKNSFQHYWHKASLQFPQEILPANVLLLVAAGKQYKDTTEKIWENSALGTWVLLVTASPFILGLNSEAVTSVLRSAELPTHLTSILHLCLSCPSVNTRQQYFFFLSFLSFLGAEVLKGAVLHCFGTAGSSSQLKVL